MKTLAIALASALVAGIAVYAWRSAELADRQDRLLEAIMNETRAEIRAEQLEEDLQELEQLLAEEPDDSARDAGSQDDSVPPLTIEPDGRYFGFITQIGAEAAPPVLVADFAEFLTGEEAQSAAEEAGVVQPGEPVPNDYFISNVNPRLRTLQIDEDVIVELSTWRTGSTGIPDPRRASLSTLARIFEDPKPRYMSVTHNGYWLRIKDGYVTRLEEQYVP